MSGVSKKTTTLVVGDQDVSLLAGHTKCFEHRKVQQLASQRLGIRILNASEVLGMAGTVEPNQNNGQRGFGGLCMNRLKPFGW